jgi:YVTN family beta-propeller protein
MTVTKRYASPKANICILLVMVVLLAVSADALQQHISTTPLLAGESEPDRFAYPFAARAKRSSSSIAISPDGATLLVVNPDSNSLTLADTISRSVVTELTVGVDPRSVAVSPDGATAYVTNQGSDSVSVIRLAARTVITEVAVGDRPVGVAVSPDGRFVAVAELGDDRVRFLDARSLFTLSVVGVADRPHGLAFTPDGRRLLVTHLLSGDVTVLPIQPFIAYLPLITLSQPAEYTVRNAHHPFRISYFVSSIPRSATLAPALRRAQRSASAGVEDPQSTIPTWPHVAPAPAIVVNATGTRAYLPQTMANGLGFNTQFDTSVFAKVSVLDLVANTHRTSEHISLPEKDTPVGLPWDVALARDDTELWVVNAASDDISILNIITPTQPSRVAHIPVGHNPRGIVISPDGNAAYVNNTLAGTVSVIDANTYTVTAVITTTDIPLPSTLLHGKQLFHSSARPDLARARWISCNTCHIEGEQDGRTWLLQYTGSVPPGATPIITRNTTSLLGMIETYPLRWSAEWDESADSEFSVRFEQFGSGLIHDGDMNPTLGAPNQGRSYDLDCLAAFIDSLVAPARTHTLTPAELRGKAVFESAETQCASCHPAPLYTDLKVHDVGTANAYGEWFGPLIDTPTLRFLYDSAPYLHDGRAATLRDVLTTRNPNDRHGVTLHLAKSELEDLVAFLLALPYQAGP